MSSKDKEANYSKPGLKAEDFAKMQILGEVQLSPDARQLYYEVSYINREQNINRGEIWQLEVASQQTRRLTAGPRRDSLPRLSLDGKNLAFLSDRSGDTNKKPQVFLLNLAQPGEAQQITTFQSAVTAIAWSPDNRYLAVVVETPDDPAKAAHWHEPETSQDRREREAREAEEKRVGGSPVTFKQVHLRADGRRTLIPDDAHSQLWLVDTADLADNKQPPRQLTFGFFNVLQPGFSPDGKRIVFSSARGNEQERDFTCITDLWSIPTFAANEENNSPAEPLKLTESRGPAANPAWSPDGKYIAYLGHTNPKDGSFLELNRVWVLELDENGVPSQPARCLTAKLDLPVTNLLNTDVRTATEMPLLWSGDSRAVFFAACHIGSMQLFRVEADGESEPQPITQTDRHIYAYSIARDEVGHLAFAACDPLNPGDVFIVQPSANNNPASIKQLTNLNKGWLAEYYLAQPETVRVQSQDKTVEIEGWLLKPPGYDESNTKFPLVVEIHGGPHTAYGHSFYFEFQVLAAQGQAVLYSNPRGSVGYGYAFAAAIHNDWGNRDYQDVMSIVDYVIEQADGKLDTQRLGVIGGSYGGYMTNWIISHTNRFKAALAERCVSNLVTMYNLSDISFRFVESEFDGNIWTNSRIWECSPLAHADKVNTPLLLLHSEADYRCPIEQAEEFYFALKRLGREVELVRTPGEDHNLSRSGSPDHRVGRLSLITDWFASRL